MVVYSKDTGQIRAILPDFQDPITFFHFESQEFKDNLATLQLENPPYNLIDGYKVENGDIVKKTLEEISPPISEDPTPEQQEIKVLKEQVSELTKVIDIMIGGATH